MGIVTFFFCNFAAIIYYRNVLSIPTKGITLCLAN